MNEKEKQKYIKAEPWLNDPYLVVPIGTTAVKKCKACEKLFYTVEFANDTRFVDHKLPVCTADVKTNNVQALHDTELTQRCKTCGDDLSIGMFTVDMATNELRSVCRTCQKPPKPLSEDF